MQFELIAKIDYSMQTNNGRVLTVVTEPAKDEFSHPSRFKLYSEQALGAQGQVVQVKGHLNGVIKRRNWIDKATGQQREIDDDSTFLNVDNAVPYVPPQDKKVS